MKTENSDSSANGRLEDECVKPDSSVSQVLLQDEEDFSLLCFFFITEEG